MIAGFPPATTIEGMSLTTTLFAEITLPFPIVVPGKTMELAPIQTLSSITIGLQSPLVLILFCTLGKDKSCPLPSII